MNKDRATAHAAASMFHSAPGQIPADVRDLSSKATDLSKVAETSDKRRAQAENERARRVAMIVWAWDRKMRSAFKGIMPSPRRHAMMREAYAEREVRGEV